ncbi:MAG TPA: PqqD family protein [Candidatus Acidoferrum sp.]|nr:PqqD family protein [Candidatus Acidoferrum sp.]
MPPGSERLRSVHTADGGIILDVRNGKMFSLNVSGSAIFQLLEQGFSEDRIVDQLVRRFGIPAQTARADLAAFCELLRDRALLTANLHSERD